VGLKHTGHRGSPILGDRVDIGAGAKILGTIRIGNDVIIGANAVVITDVPPDSLAVGVPARVLSRKTQSPVVTRDVVTSQAIEEEGVHASF
jgi:serine O-acetyltransferase